MKVFLFISLIIISAFNTIISAKEIEIIKEHSKITFDIDYMLVTKVQGQFKDYYGSLNINEDKNEIYNIKVTALTNSIDTNDGKRDFHLKGVEFFQAANYPEILFESKGPFKFSLSKKFNVKGKVKDPWNKENYFFELTGVVDRKTYGMIWNKKMDNGGVLIGDNVNINITIQAQPSGDKTAFSTHMIPSTKGIIERDQLKKGLIKKLTTSTDPKDYLPQTKNK